MKSLEWSSLITSRHAAGSTGWHMDLFGCVTEGSGVSSRFRRLVFVSPCRAVWRSAFPLYRRGRVETEESSSHVSWVETGSFWRKLTGSIVAIRGNISNGKSETYRIKMQVNGQTWAGNLLIFLGEWKWRRIREIHRDCRGLVTVTPLNHWYSCFDDRRGTLLSEFWLRIGVDNIRECFTSKQVQKNHQTQSVTVKDS